MTERLSPLALPVALIAALAVIVAGQPTVTAAALFGAAGLVALAAAWPLALRRDRSWPGWTLTAVGSVVTLVGQGAAATRPTSVTNTVELLGATVALAGLLVVNRAKRSNRDDHGSIDAAVLGVAAVAFVWQLAHGTSDATGADGMAFALPLLAALQLIALARVIFATTIRERASRFLAAGLAVVAATATLQSLALSGANPLGDQFPRALSLVGWVLLATGLVHPDRAPLSEPTLRPRAFIPTARLAVLAVAQSSTGAAIVVNGWLDRPLDLPALALCQIVAGLLFLARVATLVGVVERARASARRRDRWYRQLVRHSTDVLFVIDNDGHLQFASPAMETALGVAPGDALGTSLVSYFDSDDAAGFVAALAGLRDHRNGAHTGAGSARQGATPSPDVGTVQVRLQHRDGTVRWADLSLTDRTNDPAVNGIVVNARDVTLRKRQEEEIAFAYDKQAAVAGLGRAALAGASVHDLAAVAVAQIHKTLGVNACELYKLPAGSDLLHLEAARGPLADQVDQLTLTVGPTAQPAYALAERCEILSPDLDNERRFDTTFHRRLAMRSAASVLVRGEHTLYGVMTVSSLRPGAFGDQDIVFLTTMANELALALERRTAEEETRHQALHDALTQLPNRVMFLDRLATVTQRNAPEDTFLGVLFLDLDHFKLVNDSLGHDVGDELLCEVATRLRQAMRPDGSVARFGGDEFVVLCEELGSVAQAGTIARRVREHMDPPFMLDGTEVHVSASIGIAVAAGHLGHGWPAARRRRCDVQGQGEGAGPLRGVRPHDARPAMSARCNGDRLRQGARPARQFVLHYQPIVRVGDLRTIGVEALVRWQHPEWGLLGPDRFIPVAESSGLIDEVGAYVLAEACGSLARWQKLEGDRVELVTVNLSASQLRNANLVDLVRDTLRTTGADPERLCLEITETAVMADVDRSTPVLQSLRDLGVRIAVDDFGTGYSSLAYLRKLPADILNIDREFIRGRRRPAPRTAPSPTSSWNSPIFWDWKRWPKAWRSSPNWVSYARSIATTPRATSSARQSPSTS